MSFTSFSDRPLLTREEIARQVHAVSLRRGLDELATVIALMTIATEVGAKGSVVVPVECEGSHVEELPARLRVERRPQCGLFPATERSRWGGRYGQRQLVGVDAVPHDP